MNWTEINAKQWLLCEINRISPSRFANSTDCLLREIWSSNKKKPLLGTHPDAILGSVMHKVFEGKTNNNWKPDFDQIWAEAEEDLVSKNEEVRPLKSSSRYYWAKREMCKKYMETLHSNFVSISNASYKAESWVESKSKKVGGKIDLIKIKDSELFIYDFKTGKIFEDNSQVKETYEVQMKLYAAMCSESESVGRHWPKALFLIDVAGKFHEINYDKKEALDLLRKAENLLDKINENIKQNNDPVNYALVGKHCSFCQFRPACKKFRISNYDFEFLKDISGFIKDWKDFENGNSKVTFENGVVMWWRNEMIFNIQGYVTITDCINDKCGSGMLKSTKKSKLFKHQDTK